MKLTYKLKWTGLQKADMDYRSRLVRMRQLDEQLSQFRNLQANPEPQSGQFLFLGCSNLGELGDSHKLHIAALKSVDLLELRP